MRFLSIKHNRGLFFVLFLVIFLAVALFFVFGGKTSVNAESIQSDVNVEVNSVLELSLQTCNSADSSLVEVDITPSTAGTFRSNCQIATVHTNTPGYSLTAKASSSTLDYLNPTIVSLLPTIASTANSTASPSTLSNDTWGFATENRLNFDSTYTIDNATNNYAALPTTDATIYHTTDFPLPETSHKFFYAAKLTPATMAGSYATTITYTAVGEDVIPPTNYLNKVVAKNKVTTMQTMTAEVCALADYDNANNGNNENNTVILTDIRNDQDYRIRKLADNRCWMIDNMKLANATLTPADSNVLSNYSLMAISSTHGTTDDTPYVDDPAINSPDKEYCINNTAQGGSGFIESYSPDSLTGCGYLYSWSAATAGTGDGISTDGQNATGSICPVGWRLPTGTSSGEFAVLNGSMLSGTPSAAAITNTDVSRANWWSTGSFSGSYAGAFNVSMWYFQGSYSYWWSSTALSAANAYIASVSHVGLYPMDATNQFGGQSVRCLL